MIFFRPPGVLRVLVSAEKGLTPVLMAFFEWCAPVVAGRSPAPAPGGRFSSGPPLPAPHTAAALPARAAKRPRAEAALWEVVVCVVVGGRVGVKGCGGGEQVERAPFAAGPADSGVAAFGPGSGRRCGRAQWALPATHSPCALSCARGGRHHAWVNRRSTTARCSRQ